jgi:hypothetical protein
MMVFIVDSRDVLVPIGFHVVDLIDGLNGIPKIALRKSETKTVKKFAGWGWIKFFSRSL